MAKISDYAFAVIAPKNIILPFSIRSTRKQCISDFEQSNYVSWEIAKKNGYKWAKIFIETVK